MLLADVARTSEAVRAAAGRRAKWERIADCLCAAAPDEVPIAVAYLSGELRQRQLGIGFAGVRELPPPAAEATLGLRAVDAALAEIAGVRGSGSVTARRERLAALFAAATAEEQGFLRALVVGGLRQGALEGVVAEAVARAAGVPVAAVRRALTVAGSLPAVAEAAFAGGAPALAAMQLEVGRPLRPMLAQTASTIAEALGRISPAALEVKLDGARVQVHRDADEVAIFTRSLDDITARLPEVVQAVRALDARTLVLDGEVIALDDAGRPHPFQITASRVGTRRTGAGATIPLTPVFFDLLHVDGTSFLDHPGAERRAALEALAPPAQCIERLVTDDPAAGQAFLDGALARGHEGVMVKALDAPYEAGSRGASWLKVKREHTLDLVVLAAEWGHGRRRGLLSNLHLGARDPASDGFVMLGKTFKGLTDATLAWQTERLLALEERRDASTVFVTPTLVVEIAFDGFQASTRYPGGVALRFARVRGYREDKTAAEADTIETVHALFAGPGRS